MQFRTTLLSMFAAVAAAQNSTDTESLPDLVQQLPQCAMGCFMKGAKAVDCAVTDFACLCGDKKQALINEAAPCVAFSSGCKSEDLNTAASVAPKICSVVSNNPSPAAVSSASALVESAAKETGNAAGRPEVGFGFLGLAALAAAAL